MRVTFESIENIGGLEILVNFRCIENGFDVEVYGRVSMTNPDYDKQLDVSLIKVGSLEYEPTEIKFSALSDEIYNYIDNAVQEIIQQDIDQYNNAIREWETFFKL